MPAARLAPTVPDLTRHTELCSHFGECGGCRSQDVPYPAQVAAKADALQTLFAAYWDAPISVAPSPVVWHYRNKVDPVFAPMQYEVAPPKDFQRETVLGYKKRGRWFWPLDIEECRIAPLGIERLFEAARVWYRDQGLRAYDERTGQGLLDVLLVREGRHTGERMVVLITRPGTPEPGPFIEAVQAAWPVASIWHGERSGSADVAQADVLHLWHGAPQITERLHIADGAAERTLQFRISPMSFFQTNTLATELLYSHLRAWVKETAPHVLYDLYGGSGGIALSCADQVGRIYSVEAVSAASEDGRANAALNGADNVMFITEKVEHYLRYQREAEGLAPNAAVIVDPARAGMHPKALRRLIELAPTDLCYVSCNPKILAQEMAALSEHYTLTGLRGFDLFPHTPHVEVVATFHRK